MNYSQSVHVVGDTTVTTTPTLLRSVALAAGADAARIIIRDGSVVSGTAKIVLRAAAGDTVVWTAAAPEGIILGTGLAIDLNAGTTPDISVEYEGIR